MGYFRSTRGNRLATSRLWSYTTVPFFTDPLQIRLVTSLFSPLAPLWLIMLRSVEGMWERRDTGFLPDPLLFGVGVGQELVAYHLVARSAE